MTEEIESVTVSAPDVTGDGGIDVTLMRGTNPSVIVLVDRGGGDPATSVTLSIHEARALIAALATIL